MSLPRYVPIGGEPISAPPYLAKGATFYGFIVDADAASLGAYLDRYLNAPRGDASERYVPLVSSVVLLAADLARLSSANPAEASRGWIHEIDIAYWIPYAKVKPLGPLTVVEEIGFFITYLFVDNGWAMSAGREVYGLPKLLAKNAIPSAPDDPGEFSVETQVIERYADDAPAQYKRLIEITRTDSPRRGELQPIWKSAAEAVAGVYKLLAGGGDKIVVPGLGLIVEIAEMLLKQESRMVALKQFQDISGEGAACYQALVQFGAKSSNYTGAGLLAGQWQVSIADVESHPIARELGLSPVSTAVAAPWLSCDFEMMLGKTLWTAGG